VKHLERIVSVGYVCGGMLLGVMFEHMGPDIGGFALCGLAGVALVVLSGLADVAGHEKP